jgi:thioredoxin reductase
MKVEDVIIVGGGAAGYTAALYAARALRSPLVFEGYAWGGLLQQTGEVENFPGFAEGISGPDLMTAMRDQAQRFGARLRSEDVTAVKLSEETGLHSVFVGEHEYRARALVLATGASHHLLGIVMRLSSKIRKCWWLEAVTARWRRRFSSPSSRVKLQSFIADMNSGPRRSCASACVRAQT